jgi:branched-chain amino acid transport system substrate-binding protein
MARSKGVLATLVSLAMIAGACAGDDDTTGTGEASGGSVTEAAGDDAGDDDTAEGETSQDGSEASGDDTSGIDTSGGDTSGDDTSGGDTADGDTADGDTADGDTAGDDSADGTVDDGDTSGSDDGGTDLEALGLWDDGPCDASLDPLVVGNISPHESPVLSLIDHVIALEAAAEAFNARGGANGSCIEIVACDDQNNFDQVLSCVGELEDAGVDVTVNDSGTIAQGEVSAALADAGIPRVGGNVSPADWSDQNAYPLAASTTATTLLIPEGLIQQGIDEIAVARVDLPEAAAAISLFDSVYADEGATFPADLPVPAGTTDYTQFVLAAQDADAGGMAILLGAQEATQVLRAAEQLGSDLQIGATLGSFSFTEVSELGDAAANMTFVWPFPPATADLPVYEVVRADLASSGEEALEPENAVAGAVLSWIGLYGLLSVIRDAGLTELSGDAIAAALDAASDVPMLGIFGEATWTPALNYDGAFQRIGIDHMTYWSWDPSADWEGDDGNFVLGGEFGVDETLCGSALGAPEC